MSDSKSPAERIPDLLRPYLDQSEVKCVWDIGSRDGVEATALHVAYPRALIHAFEPNPDTYSAVEAVAEKCSAIQSHNLALSDIDGECTFHKIDREKTRTSWADGNPGASSLFPASGKYDGIEKYVQEKITVPAATAKSLIEDNQVPPPDLVWMDVQGAELLVLRGFAGHLTSIKAIYVELSLQGIYSGQALAHEVVQYLERDFCWVKVPNTGNWQFDALFVRRDLAGLRGSAMNFQFRVAMRIPGKPGVAVSLTRPRLSAAMAALTKRLADGLRERRSPTLKRSLYRVFQSGSQIPIPKVGHASRIFLEASLPCDPLADEVDLPEVDLIIACHSKDAVVLPLAVAGALSSSRNPINRVLVIAPSPQLLETSDLPAGAELIDEHDLLPAHIFEAIRRSVPGVRQGWVIQQVVKLFASLVSKNPGSLVVDADTILLKRRTFLDSRGRQILSVSHERHEPYLDHAKRHWGSQAASRISFVSHHQLMQREIVEMMFGADGSGLSDWVCEADWQHSSAVSEYHSYGSWLIANHPSRALLACWGNVAIPPYCLPDRSNDVNLALARLKEDYPTWWSLSAHSYLG